MIQILGILIIVICFIFDQELVSINWGYLNKGIVFLMLLFIFRFCSISSMKTMPEIFDFNTIWTVFCEDALFVLPCYVLLRRVDFNFTSFAGLYSLLCITTFSWGHYYQGISGCIFAIWYFTLSFRVGKKYGFGTIMILHVLYDFLIVFSIKMHNLMIK